MINHYIDLHEYINENIYRLPVKENQIITEAIDWGGVIKNTLIGGGIIALILLVLKFIFGKNNVSSSGGSGGGGGINNLLNSNKTIQNIKEDNKIIFTNIRKTINEIDNKTINKNKFIEYNDLFNLIKKLCRASKDFKEYIKKLKGMN